MEYEYSFWDINGWIWNDIPDIPHVIKFVHNFGTVQVIANEYSLKAELVQHFANDK